MPERRAAAALKTVPVLRVAVKMPALVPALTVAGSLLAADPMAAAPPSPGDALPRPPAPQAAVDLPEQVGAWSRIEPARTYDAETIFDYMDGAAELVVGYGFGSLEVHEYGSRPEGERDADRITIEIYRMRSSDDAFGLQSQDWSGEIVLDDEIPPDKAATTPLASEHASAYPRALCAGSHLRVRSGELFVRILSRRQSEESRAAFLEIGRIFLSARPAAPLPALVTSLPDTIASTLRLGRSEVCYLRSHAVLNAMQYVGAENVLALGPSTEAVLASYTVPSSHRGIDDTPPADAVPPGAVAPPGVAAAPSGASVRILVVRYPSGQAAEQASARLQEKGWGPSIGGHGGDAGVPCARSSGDGAVLAAVLSTTAEEPPDRLLSAILAPFVSSLPHPLGYDR